MLHVLVLSAVTLVASKERRLNDQQVAFIWSLLQQKARGSADAGFLLLTLFQQGEAARNWGWDSFGRGQQWLDWWLVLRPLPERAMSANEFFCFYVFWDESEMRAVSRRPNILDRIVRARLYTVAYMYRVKLGQEPITIDHIKKEWLYWEQDAYLETKDDIETDLHHYYLDGERRYFPEWVNRLRWCYWLFGRNGEVTRVTDTTWKRDYLAFRKWLSENEPYMRFDEEKFRFVVDENAKTSRRPLPAAERVIRSSVSPFPDWEGSTPLTYDNRFAVH